MRRKPVTSSVIASVGHSARARTLEIEVLSGSVYQYLGVEAEVFRGLLEAPSNGTYFNAHIREA